MVAIEGSWGRGKTDLLARLAAATHAPDPDQRPRGLAREAVWLNPWGYGTADLLTPLVTELGRRAARQGMPAADLRQVASTIVRAGVAFGMKSAAQAVPVGGALLSALAEPVDALVEAMMSPPEHTAGAPDLDPVAAMAGRFAALVAAALPPDEREHGARLLICIDDLDRCLPDRQVALLQAVRFLLSAGAPATFVVAIDPTLAREAVRAHYRSDGFDVDRYLDKMYDLRVSLRGLAAPDLVALVRGLLDRPVLLDTRTAPLAALAADRLGTDPHDLALALAGQCHRGGHGNPRVVRRVVDRLMVLLSTGTGPLVPPPLPALPPALIAAWLLICDRAPAARRQLQQAGLRQEWVSLVTHTVRWTHRHQPGRGPTGPGPHPSIARLEAQGLPTPQAAPLFAALVAPDWSTHGEGLAALDGALVAQGL